MSDYLSIKIREGMARMEREHPCLFQVADTPKTLKAEKELNEIWIAWRKDPKVSLEHVRLKFKAWTDALIEASRVQERLFA